MSAFSPALVRAWDTALSLSKRRNFMFSMSGLFSSASINASPKSICRFGKMLSTLTFNSKSCWMPKYERSSCMAFSTSMRAFMRLVSSVSLFISSCSISFSLMVPML